MSSSQRRIGPTSLLRLRIWSSRFSSPRNCAHLPSSAWSTTGLNWIWTRCRFPRYTQLRSNALRPSQRPTSSDRASSTSLLTDADCKKMRLKDSASCSRELTTRWSDMYHMMPAANILRAVSLIKANSNASLRPWTSMVTGGYIGTNFYQLSSIILYSWRMRT